MKNILLLALAAACITSCSDGMDGCDGDVRVPLQVGTSIDARSRGFIPGNNFTDENLRIGISLFDQNTGGPYEGKTDGYVNVPYVSTLDGTTGNPVLWSSSTPIALSPAQGKAVAYYPHSVSVTDIHAIPVDVTVSQDDFMYSGWSENISALHPQAVFTMKHALSAVNLVFRTSGYTGPAQVSSVSVTSESFACSALLDAVSGELSSLGGKGLPISLPASFSISSSGVSKHVLVVPDISVAAPSFRVEMMIDGKRYVVPLRVPEALAQSRVYRFTLTLHDSRLDVSQVTVTDWNTVEMEDGELKP